MKKPYTVGKAVWFEDGDQFPVRLEGRELAICWHKNEHDAEFYCRLLNDAHERAAGIQDKEGENKPVAYTTANKDHDYSVSVISASTWDQLPEEGRMRQTFCIPLYAHLAPKEVKEGPSVDQIMDAVQKWHAGDDGWSHLRSAIAALFTQTQVEP